MICTYCSHEVSEYRRADNRYRFCEPCGWVMHHLCWSEALALERLPCPRGLVETYERREAVEIEPAEFTPTGKRRRKMVTKVHEYRDILEGHGDGIGMRGEWSQSRL